MRYPSIDDRCALLYTARFLLRAKDPEAVIVRLSRPGSLASLTVKGLGLVREYMTLLPSLLSDYELHKAEERCDEIVCARYGWPTMTSLGYRHLLPGTDNPYEEQ